MQGSAAHANQGSTHHNLHIFVAGVVQQKDKHNKHIVVVVVVLYISHSGEI